MIIRKVIVDNFRCFRHFELCFDDTLSILVGDNETGKSTLLEAINLGLTGQINGRSVFYELSPYLFNKSTVSEYIANLREGKKISPPFISIEIFLENLPEFAELRGSNNLRREDAIGVMLKIEFDDDYKTEYVNYISNPDEIETVPIEYYAVRWYSFAHNTITKRSLKLNVSFIDTTTIRLQYGSDYYIQKIIDDSLDNKEKAELSLAYRKLKQAFGSEKALVQINQKLKNEKGKISDKDLTVSIDISQKASWESNLTSYLDDIPFQYIGKGDQNILKMLIALERSAKDSHLILIEEPENHLSYSTLNHLINKIKDKCKDKQVVLSTHSTFVMNKLGINNVIMFGEDQKTTSLKNLTPSTQDYFIKLPGYDTLRLIIAKKAILVEGPSDELFIQKAYLLKHKKLPIENGVDVISVRGLSFKRFLEISVLLNKKVIVVTDNDGDYKNNIENKYSEYFGIDHIMICCEKDDNYVTLESHIVRVNKLNVLNKIFSRNDKDKKDMLSYMKNNKTECALLLFKTMLDISIPQYIMEAIDD
ncbi:MAG: AAA family ATPase [Syntrophobacterales bacterium]|jgi:predicted ATP-dependent endonuclease of OLD family|nr:AAA family ATPase [Syntrophobacterales bacterium]